MRKLRQGMDSLLKTSRLLCSVLRLQQLKEAVRYSPSQSLYALEAVLGIRIRRIRVFLGLLDPDPFVRGVDPDPSLF
jgi:hypothetical protein